MTKKPYTSKKEKPEPTLVEATVPADAAPVPDFAKQKKSLLAQQQEVIAQISQLETALAQAREVKAKIEGALEITDAYVQMVRAA